MKYYRHTGNKYGNKITEVDGIRFDSRKEARRWEELKLLEKVGAITDLKRQVPFELQPAFVDKDGHKQRAWTYIADFTYIEKDGHMVIEDVKSDGTRDNQVYRIKKKRMAYLGYYITEV